MKFDKLLAGTLSLVLILGLVPSVLAESSTVGDGSATGPTILSAATADPDDIIFESSGMPDDVNGLRLTQWIAADDFVLAENDDITDVHFIFGIEFGSQWDGTMEYFFFEDDNGSPGTLIANGTAVNLETEDLGPGNFGDLMTVWFDLEDGVPLDGGVTYWIGIHAQDDFEFNSGPFWGTTSEIFGATSHSCPGGVIENCFAQAFDVWFQLTSKDQVVGGEILPLDSTALLMAGMSANLSIIIPIAAGIAGVGAFYIRSRMNKD